MTGELPGWLSGSLVVNGGGDFTRMQHMFDGYALICSVRVEAGKAWGRQRYVQTKAYNSYKEQGAPGASCEAAAYRYRCVCNNTTMSQEQFQIEMAALHHSSSGLRACLPHKRCQSAM